MSGEQSAVECADVLALVRVEQWKSGELFAQGDGLLLQSVFQAVHRVLRAWRVMGGWRRPIGGTPIPDAHDDASDAVLGHAVGRCVQQPGGGLVPRRLHRAARSINEGGAVLVFHLTHAGNVFHDHGAGLEDFEQIDQFVEQVVTLILGGGSCTVRTLGAQAGPGEPLTGRPADQHVDGGLTDDLPDGLGLSTEIADIAAQHGTLVDLGVVEPVGAHGVLVGVDGQDGAVARAAKPL
ncbi:hypothetical protein GCM10010841_08820 [Deinococcus aerophilus]|uniref:Uncharacterized protein n=1 Tax=Deinococcus aerophilus TaxID=522488 RepID=A0ABQ2GN15_9DEIO|nr:hypothetical protein GCM10010841_08820 [Deinococcus aerophilus]